MGGPDIRDVEKHISFLLILWRMWAGRVFTRTREVYLLCNLAYSDSERISLLFPGRKENEESPRGDGGKYYLAINEAHF